MSFPDVLVIVRPVTITLTLPPPLAVVAMAMTADSLVAVVCEVQDRPPLVA